MLTLLCSQGVPMICGGDEIGRSQNGNNNAYAQDNRHKLVRLEPRRPREIAVCLHRQAGGNAPPASQSAPPKILSGSQHLSRRDPGREVDGRCEKDIVWLRPDGNEMTAEEWHAGWVRCIGLRLNGRTLDDVNGLGEPIRDETFLILLNPHTEPIRFYMPRDEGTAWELTIDSANPAARKSR